MKFIIAIISASILYFLAIMPRLRKKPDITPFVGRYYAHRGLHNNNSDAPENSLEAFRLAIENGYGIELDVQLTKDKIPVVFHDYSLKRVCGESKKVYELTYEELQELHLYQSDERIPLFSEALKLVDGKVPLIIELKIEAKVGETCEIVDSILRKYKGVYCIESFHPFALIWYRIHHTEIMRGQLSSDFIKDKEAGNKVVYFILQNLLLNFLSKPDFIAYNYKYRNKLSFILATRFYKAKAFAWTIKSEQALELSRKSFEFFIFDSFIPKEK